MNQSPTDRMNIIKRRLMLYKAVHEFPENERIRNALIRTYDVGYMRDAALDGIYIGYNRFDEVFALELNTALRERGIPVWFDQIDIDPHEDWTHAVSKAIVRSGLMLVVVSPLAIDDLHLQREIQLFFDAGKIVLPVMSETCNPNRLPLFIPPIDFVTSFETGLQELLASVSGSSLVNA